MKNYVLAAVLGFIVGVTSYYYLGIPKTITEIKEVEVEKVVEKIIEKPVVEEKIVIKEVEVPKEIETIRKNSAPVLVGTVSIDRNEYLGQLLKREGIDCNILNAKNHENEAEIIANAGKKNSLESPCHAYDHPGCLCDPSKCKGYSR